MPLLLLIGFLGGVITGISPCILPVLPVVLAAGVAPAEQRPAARGADGLPAADDPGGAEPLPSSPAPVDEVVQRRRRRRPYVVVAGLVSSFSLSILVGSSLLSLLGLPQDFLRDAGLVVLGVVGIGLIFPQVGDLLERPFARMVRGGRYEGNSGFLLGLSLGVLFVPCAGPVLAAITSVSGSHRVGVSTVVLTAAFAVGVAVPLVAVALAGTQIVERVRSLRRRAVLVRRTTGVVFLAVVVVLQFNLADGLQKAVPGYVDSLQNLVEGGASAKHALASLTQEPVTALSSCVQDDPALQDCGKAPEFTGIVKWLNTPGDEPLTMAGLRGKVVLVDFWTYSCINCQRSLPHVEAWDRAYRADGLVVVGVHTPEFAFEHVVSNVASQAAALGVHYPVAVDNDYGTWNAYGNDSWPAEYLIDAQGIVRYVSIGEGGYSETESAIRELLTAAGAKHLPPATGVPDRAPAQMTTAESYLGTDRLDNNGGTPVVTSQQATYTLPAPADLPEGELAFGGRWAVGPQAATAGPGAELELQYEADDVYLVLGGTGTVAISVGGVSLGRVAVGGVPRLYTMVHGSAFAPGTLLLRVSPGVQAYDFTFG